MSWSPVGCFVYVPSSHQSLNDSRLPTREGTAHPGRVPSESALDGHGTSIGHNLLILLEISKTLLMFVVKTDSSLDPVNLLSLCFGYYSP